jgi:hypothetical protein
LSPNSETCYDAGVSFEKWGTHYLFIANSLATQIVGGAKELVVIL